MATVLTTAQRKALLETTLDRYLTELAEGDIKPNYTINSQSVDWATYRDKLNQWIRETQELIDVIDDEGGIVEEVTQFCT